jgi:hypothetical protein
MGGTLLARQVHGPHLFTEVPAQIGAAGDWVVDGAVSAAAVLAGDGVPHGASAGTGASVLDGHTGAATGDSAGIPGRTVRTHITRTGTLLLPTITLTILITPSTGTTTLPRTGLARRGTTMRRRMSQFL